MCPLRESLRPNPHNADHDGVTFSARDRSEIQAELAHLKGEYKPHLSPFEIDELRRAGICDLDKLHGDLKSVTMHCVDRHLLNKSEAAHLRLIMDNPDLTDEQRSAYISELLCTVLERHLAFIERKSSGDAPHRIIRSNTPEIIEKHRPAVSKPYDPLDPANQRQKSVALMYNDENRPDPNMKYLMEMYARLREYERRQERKKQLAENRRIKDAFLGKRAASYPNAASPDLISEEQDV